MSKYDLGVSKVIITPNVEINLRDDAERDYIVSVYTRAGETQYIITEKDLYEFLMKGVKRDAGKNV